MSNAAETPAVQAPDHESFDLIAAIQGISYPEETVEVYLDDNIMYLLDKAKSALRKAEILGQEDDKARLEEEIENLRDAASGVRFQFLLRAQPRRIHQAATREALKRFPEEKDVFGRVIEDDERDEFFTNRLWALHIVEITSPSGAKQVGLSEEEVQSFRDLAPRSAQNAIQRTLDGLYKGADQGYEAMIQDNDFLSGASPEA